MKHTMKVYKNSPDHSAYLAARFDETKTGQSFDWAGHRWAYDGTRFDDSGDYDLLYRFDDLPYPEDVSVTTDDMTIRDYFATAAMQGVMASGTAMSIGTNHEEAMLDMARAFYSMADAMIKARELP